MAWIITHDLTANPTAAAPSNLNAVGVAGPSTITDSALRLLQAGIGIPFRMLDDDGTVYYRGVWLNTPDCASYDAPEYQPLHDFGTPNAGAVTIQHQAAPGRWTTI